MRLILLSMILTCITLQGNSQTVLTYIFREMHKEGVPSEKFREKTEVTWNENAYWNVVVRMTTDNGVTRIDFHTKSLLQSKYDPNGNYCNYYEAESPKIPSVLICCPTNKKYFSFTYGEGRNTVLWLISNE